MSRIDVRKTAKLYINGAFVRSESGRVYSVEHADGSAVVRVSQGSRKDLRDAVRGSRSAQTGWAERTGYNRGQILYRIAEIMEERRDTFVDRLLTGGMSDDAAEAELDVSVDRLVWYAGWADKFAQVFGNLNPVAGPFFNISAPEPTGLVGVVLADASPLLGIVSRVAPIIVSGNTAVVVVGGPRPLASVALTEVLATADVPAGVVNIITGDAQELGPVLANHMDVNALDIVGVEPTLAAAMTRDAAENVKRVTVEAEPQFMDEAAQSPYIIAKFVETKTVWHPKGV
ncbi:Aldehyde dehydrogenase [hydrothermal vent metagenome]|uniref:Aldehyde dehydrogenase n=1 Tax=hydrothermal vent metagenome TaxID=652676 RepID=A0A3B0SS56_9ZZZZ